MFSLPEGFTGVPVMSTEATNFLNFRDEGCAYLDMMDMAGRVSLETMPGYVELYQEVREPIIRSLGLSDEILNNTGVNELQHFADVLLCKWFEGLYVDLSYFNDDLWHKMEQMQTLGNESLQGQDLDLFLTKML